MPEYRISKDPRGAIYYAIENLSILNYWFPQSLLPDINKIIHVCTILTNLQSPIIKPSDDQIDDELAYEEFD